MEALVELVCPACEAYWEATLPELPAARESFACPSCAERRPLAEFARTDRDLETVREAV